ncbi:MAG TPA: DUF2298 domain-containing protein, partial [Ktedonobacterales bacterium]
PPVRFGDATSANTTPTTTISPDPNPRRRVSRHEVPSGTVATAGSPVSTARSSSTISPVGLPTDASTRAEMLLLVLFGTAAALVAACELIFLRDIFNSRMNTVFKLYFQAWLLLGIAAGPALALLISAARARLRATFATTLSLSPETPTTHATTTGALALGQTTLALAPQPASLLTRLILATSQAQTDSNPPPEQTPTNGEVDRSPDPSPRRRTSRHEVPSGAVSTAGSPVSTARPRIPVPNLPLALRWLGAAGILIWGTLLVILIAAAAIYPLLATSARTGNFTSSARTLDGTAYMATDPVPVPASCTDVGAGSNAHDDEAIAWLNTHLPGEAVVVEAPGCEWTHYSRVSAFTGLPTLLGWPGGHEGEWRINWLPQHPEVDSTFGDRLNAINQIYTDSNQDAVIALLHRYHARLIYVGAAERALYPTADMRRFSAFMRVIYTRDGVTIYELP